MFASNSFDLRNEGRPDPTPSSTRGDIAGPQFRVADNDCANPNALTVDLGHQSNLMVTVAEKPLEGFVRNGQGRPGVNDDSGVVLRGNAPNGGTVNLQKATRLFRLHRADGDGHSVGDLTELTDGRTSWLQLRDGLSTDE